VTVSRNIEGRYGLLRLLRDAGIVIALSVALMIGVELFVRAFFPQRLDGTSIQGQRFSVRDPAIGMRYAASAHWRFTHPEYTVEYVINADGFRDAKVHPMPKPSGTTRVLLLGDSFTFGQGASYEDIWPVIVEKHLANSGDRHIDMVKAGIQGQNTRSELTLMQELIPKYDPDVIVVGFMINDLYDNSLYGLEEEKLEADPIGKNGVEDEPERSWLRTLQHTYVQNSRYSEFHLLSLLRRMLLASDRRYCQLYLASARAEFMAEPWTSEVTQKIRTTEILFNKMHEYASSKGKKFFVFSMPQQFQALYPKEFESTGDVDVASVDRHFSNFAREKGFKWVSALETFTAAEDPAKLFYRWDGHFTPAGNRVAADVFMREITPHLN
jgi:hypothetical protein